MTYIFIFLFLGMCLQGLLTFFQVKSYQRAMGSMKGKGLLGIGHRKGVLTGGQILILSYDRKSGTINNCQTMQGISAFERFKTAEPYLGLTLKEVKELAILEDQKLNKPKKNKKKEAKEIAPQKRGALLQAVNAIETHMKKEQRQKLHAKRREQQLIAKVE